MSDYEPFQPSNSDHGFWFMSQWCDKCEAERLNRKYPDRIDGCKILCYTMAFNIGDPEYPKEWRQDGPEGPRCTAFRPERVFEPRKSPVARRDDNAAIGDLLA